MYLIYKITFITGVLYAIATLVLGHLFDSLDFDGDIDIGVMAVLPIKPITIVTFITVFGGVGIITTLKNISAILSFIISFAIAYVTSLLIYRLIVLPLFRAQNTSAASQKDLIGVTGKVTSTIMESAFGQITYANKGNTYSSPAKSIKEKAITTGTEVVIISIEDNVFYVTPSEELFSDAPFDER